MKITFFLLVLAVLLPGAGPTMAQSSASRPMKPVSATIDPGSYDGTWWNRAPVRLIQTNLRETDALMDTDAYVQSMVDASATVVMLNVGGIVANYPTTLAYHFKTSS